MLYWHRREITDRLNSERRARAERRCDAEAEKLNAEQFDAACELIGWQRLAMILQGEEVLTLTPASWFEDSDG